ncbi:hypothetical protein GCM10023238_33280 [Streptomyces heliomycini]
MGRANGTGEPQEIVCGARNFAVGDKVVVVLPGATLPGGFSISARKTYGKTSHGMICSSDELGMGDDGTHGIIVLPPETEVGKDAIELLELVDEVLDIAVTANRGDCLSIRGVARETAIAYGLPLRDPALLDVPGPNAFGYPVKVSDPAGCDRFTARTVTGLSPEARSPIWLKRRLQKVGMRPISLAVDVTNYVMMELGQPLHAYDRNLVQGAIGVRRAEEGEKIVTLDGVERKLHAEDLVITDDRGPIGWPRHGRRRHGDRRPRRHRERDERRGHRGRPLRPGVRRAHRPPPQAVLRGLPPLRARRRPAGRLRCRASAPSTCWCCSRAVPPRPASPRSSPRPRRAPSPSPPTPGQGRGRDVRPGDRGTPPPGGRLRRLRPGRPDRHRPVLAARPQPTPTIWPKRSSAWRATRTCPPRCRSPRRAAA